MKFLLLSVFVVVATASTVYQNKNIQVNDDGTILITGNNGKKVVITRPTGPSGPKNIDISVTGDNGVTKKIQINDQNDINLKTDSNHQNSWSSLNSLDDELRSKRGSKSQGEVLCDILKEYQGINNYSQYEKLLHQVNKAVQNGLVNQKIYDLLVDLNQNYGNGDEITPNILNNVYQNKGLKHGSYGQGVGTLRQNSDQGKKGVNIDDVLGQAFYNNLLGIGQGYNIEDINEGIGQRVLIQRGWNGGNIYDILNNQNIGLSNKGWYGNNYVKEGLGLGYGGYTNDFTNTQNVLYGNNFDGLTNGVVGVVEVDLLGINGGVSNNQVVVDGNGQLRVVGGLYGNNNQAIVDSNSQVQQIIGNLNGNQGYLNRVVVDGYGNPLKIVGVTQVGNQVVYQTVPVIQRFSVGQSLLKNYLLGRQGLGNVPVNEQGVVNDRFLGLQQGIY